MPGSLRSCFVAEIFDLVPTLAIGLVLLGASPGGTLANLLTHLAKGDTALSVTMTAISSLGALVTVPLYLGLAAGHFSGADIGDISMAGVVIRVFFITIVPPGHRDVPPRSATPRRTARAKGQPTKVAFVAFLPLVVGACRERARRRPRTTSPMWL